MPNASSKPYFLCLLPQIIPDLTVMLIHLTVMLEAVLPITWRRRQSHVKGLHISCEGQCNSKYLCPSLFFLQYQIASCGFAVTMRHRDQSVIHQSACHCMMKSAMWERSHKRACRGGCACRAADTLVMSPSMPHRYPRRAS